MTRFRVSVWLRIGLMMVMLLAAGLACSLGTGDDDEKTDADSVPTLAASITPPGTRTPIPSFTPFRTSTPTQWSAQQVQRTATRIAFFPTWTPVQATVYPYDVRISYPVDGSQIAGYTTIVGSASHPRFLQYALEWGPHPNPSNLWYPLTGAQRRTVINGGLAAWDTRTVNDGTYQIRLHVWLTDGTETFALVSALRVSNQQATAVPTQTPTPRPNQAPRIDPIAGQVVNAGQAIALGVVASDPDGDAVSLFVSSSNPSIVGVQVTATNQITVAGVTAGTVTITVTANDNRGGLSSTAFLVTAKGQNRAPAISPLLSQDIEVGKARNLAIAASDPDGDALTVTAVSNAPAILTATAVNATTVQITGVAQGTAYITITASDGKGGVVNTAFQVTVGAMNKAPTIDKIPAAQSLAVGDDVNVLYVASDLDGDQITTTVASDTPGVATATVTSAGIIRLVAVAKGLTTVTLTVTDGEATTIGTFTVTVTAGNQPPTLEGIAPQTMSVSETRDVAYTASDVDGDTLTPTVSADNGGVVTATVSAPGVISLNANGAGTATVTLTVNDGVNAAVQTTFTVSVAAENIAPAIETIMVQTLAEGEARDVAYIAVDPDGDTLTASAASDNDGVVTASVTTPGTISLAAIGAGTATVTLTVDDGSNPAVTMPFSVEVLSNAPPTVGAIDAQSMTVDETRDVLYSASDPEGDTLNAAASVDNADVVTANVSTPGTISLAAIGAGTATVTLTVDDGSNPAVTVAFAVTVQTVNVPPIVNPIDPQEMVTGETRDMFYAASDADNDPLTGTATSDNEEVVSAVVNTPGVISLAAAAEGSANITVSISDGVNPAVTTTFAVTVQVVNVPPGVDPIGAVSMTAGELRDVFYTASDANADSLTGTATSDNEGVVSAVVNTPGVVSLTANTAGSANITVSISDGVNPAVSTMFAVTIQTANVPPVINPIDSQELYPGELRDVLYTASDTDNDPLTVSAASDNEGVVLATTGTPGAISLTANAAGSANVTVTVNDGVNPAVTTLFLVTVQEANVPPVINPVDPQTMAAGELRDVYYTASDANSDPLTATATSDNEGAVSAVVNTPGVISLTANVAGSANVTVTVNDGVNPAVSTLFLVTVQAANSSPVIQPIAAQSVNVGVSVNVPVAATDADGDPVSLVAASDNPGVASTVTNGSVEIIVTGAVPGTANINVEASDGKGGVATTSFQVTVLGVNNPPSIQPDPIPNQAVNVGAEVSIGITATDLDGDAVVVTALAQNQGIALAQAMGNTSIVITGVTPGDTLVDVTLDDAKGGVVITSFNVTVAEVQPTFNLMDYPILPDITQPMGQSLQQLYQSGVANFGNQAGAFAKVGDDPMDSDSFMKPFATPSSYVLDSFGSLQGMIDAYAAVPVRSSIDPTINSFNVNSVAAGTGYGLENLSSPAPAEAPCDTLGGTSLSCEYQATKPSIALISFSGANVMHMNPDQFRSELMVLVADSLSTYGVIPVLATIPAGNGYTTEQLAAYNQVIVEVASQSGTAGVPLWNLWRAIQERGISDPNSVAPQGPADFSQAALSYGYNIRNLTALQTLQTVRQAAGIQ